MRHLASVGELKNNSSDKEDRLLYKIYRIYRTRETLRYRSRRKRRQVVVGRRGQRRIRSVIATAASQAIMLALVRQQQKRLRKRIPNSFIILNYISRIDGHLVERVRFCRAFSDIEPSVINYVIYKVYSLKQTKQIVSLYQVIINYASPLLQSLVD